MSSRDAMAGVALRPVMDLSDGRVVAYDAHPRWAKGGDPPRPVDLLDVALRQAVALGSAPLLVHVPPSLLVDPAFDPVSHIRSTNCSPSEVVWMLPEPRRHPAGGIAARRRYAAALLEVGYRVGLDGVGPLTVSWEDVMEARPAFLLMGPETIKDLDDESSQAALAGLLAFSGRLGARLVAQAVDDAETARTLMDVGIFYGMGNHLHGPVVLEGKLALEGDLVVRPSWFKERAVRQLSATLEEAGVHFVPEAPRPHVIDDRRLAGLLTDWSGQLSNAGDADAVLQALGDILPQLVEFDRLAIFEADWDKYVLRPKVLIGEALQPLANVAYTLNMGITGWAFLRGKPYRCGRTGEHPEAAPIPEQEEADESLLVIPLVSGDQRLGVLDLWRDGADRFSESDLERAALLGKLGADAWRAAEQRAELAARVVTDTVTGLLNKRWWEELAPREAAQAMRSKSTIAVLLVDLDGFKKVNDSHGHAQGDLLLKQVARTLSASVRSGDAVIRYGGDEFVLLLRDCDEAGAVEVATEVQLALSRVVTPEGDRSPITASIGLALFPQHGATLEDAVAHADVAMYRAKALGRDRIALYSSVAGQTSDTASGPDGADGVEQLRPSLRFQLRNELEERSRCVQDFTTYAAKVQEWIEGASPRFDMEVRLVRSDGTTVRTRLTQLVRELPDGRRVVTGTLQELPDSCG
jgi:diguanylate cyclase (GGDEF)-like protein